MLQRRQSLEEEKTNKQIRTPETDTPSMKAIILANANVNLFSWTFTFRKVVRQHTWGEVLVSTQASSKDHFWT